MLSGALVAMAIPKAARRRREKGVTRLHLDEPGFLTAQSVDTFGWIKQVYPEATKARRLFPEATLELNSGSVLVYMWNRREPWDNP